VTVTTVEPNQADTSFSGNRLLATLAREARDLIEPHAVPIELRRGAVVLNRGEQVKSSVFPLGPTVVSMGVELEGGRTVEVASIGREGAVGGIISCGHAPAFSHAVALVGGPAIRVQMEALEKAKKASPFIANLFCRFSDYLLSQVTQSVACNSYHSILERAARWLLHAQDRAGSRLQLTQEAMADLLGVQRTTVNAVMQTLESEGLVSAGRGVINIADREGLERRSCECYKRLEDHFDAVIGTSGHGPEN